MAWREEYRQATFKNIPFYVSRHDMEGGRRAVVHEFPKRETPYTEDMGRRSKRFTVDGYVLGDDYFSLRRALQDALDSPGAGKLDHPYLGTLIVVCSGYRLSETIEEGGMGRFGMEFVETGDTSFTLTEDNFIEQAQTIKQSSFQSIEDNFVNQYDSVQAVSTALVLPDLLDMIEDARRVVRSQAEFQRQLLNARGRQVELAYLTRDLFSTVKSLLDFGTSPQDDLFAATIDNARAQVLELLRVFGFAGSGESPFISMVQSCVVSSIGGLFPLCQFDSIPDAKNFTTVFIQAIDRILHSPIDDLLFERLVELRTVVVQDIGARSVSLPTIINFVPNAAIPALVLSWAIYGTNDMEQDIIDRNKIHHPAFVPGGVELELLSHVQ